ncbi:MAG: hypothetical protein OXI51_06990 [Chloroflexota bacterium]|nr:hypothetical protein [Chloroflexota bacterium]
MVPEFADEHAIDEFAASVGEWLLTQRFGSVVPVGYRHFLWEPPGDWRTDPPHVVIELTVEDPPPPPVNWRSLPFEEQVRAWHWPEADTDAAEMAALAYALTREIPAGLAPLRPVTVKFLARSEAEGNGRPAGGL